MQRIYFAHPINTYNTPLEQMLLEKIQHHLGDDVLVINPADVRHQEIIVLLKGRYADPDEASQQIMNYFLIIAESCDGGVGLPFLDGKIGAGVYAELTGIAKDNNPLWLITHEGSLECVTDTSTLIGLSIEETRARIYNPDRTIRPYFEI